MSQEYITNLKEKTRQAKTTVKKQLLGYLSASLGLVAGLAWNEAIKTAIETYFPLGKDSISAKFIYAIVVTLFVIIAVSYLSKLFKTEEAS